MAALNAIYKALESSVEVTAGTSSDILTVPAADQTASNVYYVLVYVRGTHVTANISDCVSLRVEGATVSDSTGTIGNGAAEASPYWFAIQITTDASPADITVRIDAPAAGDNTTITDAFILLLDATQLAANMQYAEDLNNEVLSTTTVDGASLTFTPGTTGDYLIISAAEFLGAFGSTFTSHWIDIDGSDLTPLVIGTGATASGNYSSLFMRVLNLSNASHTIKNQFVHSSATFQSAKRWDTIVAIRLDAYDDYGHTYTAAETSIGTSMTEMNTVAFTPTGAGDYIVFGSFNADGVTANDDIYAQVQVDGANVLATDTGANKIRQVSNTSEEAVVTLGGAITLTATAHTVDIDAKVTTAGNGEERQIVVFGPVTSLGLTTGLTVTRTDMTETEVRENSMSVKTILLTLVGSTWGSTIGGCNALTEYLLAGLLSAGSDPLGWNAVVIGGQYGYVVLEDSPVAYWPCDETSGTTIADNVGSNDGTLTVITAGNGPSLHGKGHRPSLNFNTGLFIGPQLTVADNAAIQNIWETGGTLEFAFRPLDPAVGAATETFGRMMDKGSWNVWMNRLDGGLLAINFNHQFSGTDGHWYTNVAVPVGQDHLVQIKYDSSSTANVPAVVVNGKEQTMNVGTTPTGTRTTDVGSTFDVGGTLAQAMLISDIAMYTSELTDAQILDHLTAISSPIGMDCEDVVRTSDTVLTITIPDEFHIFDIFADETITVTAFSEVQDSGGDLTDSTNTFDITVDNSTSGYAVPAGGSVPQGSKDAPYGGFQGALGYDVITASKQLGLGDTWVFGISQPFIGHEVDNPTDRTLMVQAVALWEVD